MLTGKCKTDFKKWFNKNNHPFDIIIDDFYRLPFSMQYGVYIDFFDSVLISIDSMNERQKTRHRRYGFIIKSEIETVIKVAEYTSRNEARKEAIKKANEIYNND